ncbi:MAG: arginase family protein [Solirubrobacterales bacterium]
MTWELTGVPYTSMATPGGIAEAISTLRWRGLATRLEALGVVDAGDLSLPGPSGERGPSGLLNEDALSVLVEAACLRVEGALERERLPLLVGADCPVLLGPLLALGRRKGTPGLVMIDGHEDAWPPRRSPTGEASDSEVTIALGRVADLSKPLAAAGPLLEPSGLALVGPRDTDEIASGGITSLREEIAFFASAEQVKPTTEGAGSGMSAALEALEADGFWLHIDLDALATEIFPAVDYPQPGGLDWSQLDALASTVLADPRCRGASVVIYNPDLDPDRSAADAVVDFVCRLVSTG